MTPCSDSTPFRRPRRSPSRTAYPRGMGKLVVVIIIVAVAFWLLTKFRDNGRGGR